MSDPSSVDPKGQSDALREARDAADNLAKAGEQQADAARNISSALGKLHVSIGLGDLGPTVVVPPTDPVDPPVGPGPTDPPGPISPPVDPGPVDPPTSPPVSPPSPPVVIPPEPKPPGPGPVATIHPRLALLKKKYRSGFTPSTGSGVGGTPIDIVQSMARHDQALRPNNPSTCVEVFCGRDHWRYLNPGVGYPEDFVAYCAEHDIAVEFAVPILVDEDVIDGVKCFQDFQGLADGKYDHFFVAMAKHFGAMLRKYPTLILIVRLAWEKLEIATWNAAADVAKGDVRGGPSTGKRLIAACNRIHEIFRQESDDLILIAECFFKKCLLNIGKETYGWIDPMQLMTNANLLAVDIYLPAGDNFDTETDVSKWMRLTGDNGSPIGPYAWSDFAKKHKMELILSEWNTKAIFKDKTKPQASEWAAADRPRYFTEIFRWTRQNCLMDLLFRPITNPEHNLVDHMVKCGTEYKRLWGQKGV
jgi:hypothetical protein